MKETQGALFPDEVDHLRLSKKGGGGSSFSEADNTLKSNTLVSTLEAISYGPIVGLVNGAKSVYLDDTALMNSDNSLNFSGVSYDTRLGVPNQTSISGFEEAGSAVAVSAGVVKNTPITRTTSNIKCGAVGVTIALPNGLYNQDTSSGSLKATSVALKIWYRITGSTTWSLGADVVIDNQKVTSSYQFTTRVELPSAAQYDIKVERVTPDSTASSLRNDIQWSVLTEYVKETVTYDDVALVGVHIDASGTNSSSIPKRVFEVYGRIISVPDNFDTKTGAYSGVWDFATFKQSWTNDPVWVLFDILTNEGINPFPLDVSEIDLGSFYSASVYNNQYVTVTNSAGTSLTSPRFTLDVQTVDAFNVKDLADKICSVMNATWAWIGGQFRVIQDRAGQGVVAGFMRSNVHANGFVRSSSSITTRYNAAFVVWKDPAQKGKAVTTSYQDDDDIATNGYLDVQVEGWGISNEGQALRYARQIVDTSINQTDYLAFKSPIQGSPAAFVVPGDLIEVYDHDFAGPMAAGRLLADSTTTHLVLDREVNLSSDATVTVYFLDGSIQADVAISTVGNASQIDLSTTLNQSPLGASYIITTNSISPETYKVMSRKGPDDKGWFEFTCFNHDENKYARIEQGVTLPGRKYTNIQETALSAPTNLSFAERTVVHDYASKRVLTISWAPGKSAGSYRVAYSVNGGSETVQMVNGTFIELQVDPSVISVSVQSVSVDGALSKALRGSYTVASQEAPGSSLNPVVNLFVAGTSSTIFNTRDLTVQWANPTSNPAVWRFKVEVLVGGNVVRSQYVAGAQSGGNASWTYTFDENVQDGGPNRALTVRVYAQETSLLLSQPTSAGFTNPAPGTPSEISLTGMNLVNKVFFTMPSAADVEGLLIWRGTAPGFALSKASCVYDGPAGGWVNDPVPDNITYYYKLAAYDSFGKAYDGTGLNVSAEYSVTTVGVDSAKVVGNFTAAQLANISITATMLQNSGIAGIEILGALPTTGNFTGRQVFLTTDSKLYRYNGTAFIKSVDGADLVSNSVTARSMAIGDFTNLCTNGDGSSMDGWSAGTALNNVTFWPAVVGSNKCIEFAARDTFFGNQFKVQAGDQFYVQMDTMPYGGTTGTYNFSIGLVFYKADGSVYTWTAGATRATTVSGYHQISGSVTVDSTGNAAYAKIWVQIDGVNATIAATPSAHHYATNIVVRKKNTGKLIVDGTITATHIAAGTITGDKLYANTITADKIVSNTFSSDNVLTRGLTVRDNNGNIILSSGVPISTDYIPAIVKNNLIDSTWWAPGVGNFSKGWTNNVGEGSTTDYFERQVLHDGGMDTVWVIYKTGGGTNSGAGGWNPGGGNWFTVDPTKTYRFVVFMKRWGGSGSTWWGIQPHTVANINTQNANGNPYFVGSYSLPLDSTWYMYVGYVFPHTGVGGTSWTHQGAGIYRLSDGAKVGDGINYNWMPSTTGAGTRAYQFYTGEGGMFISKPVVEVCDGTEAPLSALLASGAVSARNPINSSNVGTYIADATIGSAKIQNVIKSDNWDGTNGWAIRKSDGWANFGNVTLRGWIHSNFPGGYSWAGNQGTGQYGFYVGPEGALWGNPHMGSGGYFQITNQGDLYTKQMRIVNGVMTIDQVNVINTVNVAGNAITIPSFNRNTNSYKAYNGQPYTAIWSVSFTTDQPCNLIIDWMARVNYANWSNLLGEAAIRVNGNVANAPDFLNRDTPLQTWNMKGNYWCASAGTYTITIWWHGSDGMYISDQCLTLFGAKK